MSVEASRRRTPAEGDAESAVSESTSGSLPPASSVKPPFGVLVLVERGFRLESIPTELDDDVRVVDLDQHVSRAVEGVALERTAVALVVAHHTSRLAVRPFVRELVGLGARDLVVRRASSRGCRATPADLTLIQAEREHAETASAVADLFRLVPDERLSRAYSIVDELPEPLRDALVVEAVMRTALARAEADALGSER